MRESEKVNNLLFRLPGSLLTRFSEIYEWCDLVHPRGRFRPGFLSLGYRSGVHSYVSDFGLNIRMLTAYASSRLSWADTNASTFGRLWGKRTRALPRHLLGLPFAPRKSLAGFVAASLTGALTAVTFWGWFAPLVNRPEVSWTWLDGFSVSSAARDQIFDSVKGRGSHRFGGWLGLGIIGIFAGLVSGVAEALGD